MERMLTVLIPAYNTESTIMRTLASLDAQIDNDFNVIVYSDGSTDNTDFLASTWCYANNTAEFYKGEHTGVGATREKLFEKCETEYFMFLDADDVLMPYATKMVNDAVRKIGGDVLLFHFYKELENGLKLYTQSDGLTWCHGKVYRKPFIEKNGITFDPGLRTAEDSYVNSICFELGEFNIVPFPICVWCNNPNSVTRCIGKHTAYDFVLDNTKALVKAAKFVSETKPVEQINFIKPNIAVIKANIDEIDDYMTPEQKEEVMEYYRKFIEIGEM